MADGKQGITNDIEVLSKVLKGNMLKTIKAAQTGHLGACCSSAELMSTLYFSDILRYDSGDPKHPDRDYVLVRGHLGPLRYNLFAMLGWMDQTEMDQYRQFGSRLAGHEDMNLTPGVDITPSGSLGMLLSYAVGARHSFKLRGQENRLFCFLGDGEEEEGNISEAARHAAKLGLDGLITIIDRNSKQLSTSLHSTDAADLSMVWRGYGWQILELQNGHDIPSIYEIYSQAALLTKNGPVCIIATTIKGNGVPGAENHYCGYHVFHATSEDDVANRIPLDEAIEQLSHGEQTRPTKRHIPKRDTLPENSAEIKQIKPSIQKGGSSYNFLQDFLEQLPDAARGKKIHLITADYPPRNLVYDGTGFFIQGIDYTNVGIREQHAIAMAHGIKTVDKNAVVIVLGGDAFLYRCADQINVLAQSQDNVILYSVQAGLSGAQNGSTHQSSGQPGSMVTMPGMTVFEPASQRDWFHVMNLALTWSGPTYIRTHKSKSEPVDFGGFTGELYYEIPISNGKIEYTLITNGLTMQDAVTAARNVYDRVEKNGRVINALSPSNVGTISKLVEPGKPLVVIYNGNPHILSSEITRDLITNQIMPSKLVEQGFMFGRTGSVKDLINYFSLNSEGITSLLLEHI